MRLPQLHRARIATAVAVGGAVLSAAAAAELFGEFSLSVFPLLWVVAIGCMSFGVTQLPRGSRHPWVVVLVALCVTLVGAVLRDAHHTIGDLTSSRSLIPDLFSGPGYVLIVVGFSLVVRHRRRGTGGGTDALLDSLLAGLAVLVLSWVYIIEPALASTSMTLGVSLSIIAYPPLSCTIFILTAQIAFMTGNERSPAQDFTVLSMAGLLCGDVLFTLTDAGLIDISPAKSMLPYGLLFSGVIFTTLHPSFRDFSRPIPPVSQAASSPRLAMVGVALTVPALVVATQHNVALRDRVVLATIIVALTVIASWRVVRALQSHARSERTLLYQATHDLLTGALNRSSVEENLNRLESEGIEHAVLFVDMDRFKLVNDTYGHAFGDELLIAMSRRLEELRPNDTVARIGGDEFVVIITGSAASDPVLAAEALRDAFDEPFHIRSVEIPVSISVGIATSGNGGAAELLRDADTAMYGAKDSGRDTVVVFDESMRNRAAKRLDLERELRHALARNELSVAFQPVVDSSVSRVIGFEALMRWTHPIYGPVSPAEFIPVAEETGVIVEIGAWILGRGCEELSRWRQLGPDYRNLWISVNVSPRQMLDADLVYTVERLLDRHDLPGNALVLEVTESMLLEEGPKVPAAIERLRRAGVRLSIDDFGTGYSSLSYLQRYPFDCVKIDRAFVDPIGDSDANDPTLVRAIVAMAAALGMSTIAEGVETPAQVKALRELGCNVAQGFFYSRPVPATEIPQTIQRIESLGAPGEFTDGEATWPLELSATDPR